MANISVQSRLDTGEIPPTNAGKSARWVAAGGFLGALAASSCCILPLVLFSLGAGGAWLGHLTALAPYQPYFIVATLGMLGYGYWLVYRKPEACADDAACAQPLPNKVIKMALWGATGLVVLSILWPLVVPMLFE